MLAQKVYDYLHQRKSAPDTFVVKKPNVIPTLQELARDVVAANFELYPALKKVPEKIQNEVKLPLS